MAGCTHTHFIRGGFTSAGRQKYKCTVCGRTSVDKKFSGRQIKRVREEIYRPCALCMKPVAKRHRPLNKLWFCCPAHCTQWQNDAAVVRRAKRGKRLNRRVNDQRRWTEKEIEFLRSNYKTMDYDEMGKILGRGKPAIQSQCLSRCFGRKNYWTSDEEQFLRANRHRGWKWCAEQLGRSRIATSIRANALGLRIHDHLSKSESNHILDLHYQGWSNADIAIEIHRPNQTVRYHLLLHGLHSNPTNYGKMQSRRRKTMQRRYGVDNCGSLRRIRRRQAGKAAMAVQVESLRRELEASQA